MHTLIAHPSDAKKVYPKFWDDRYKDERAKYKLGEVWTIIKHLLRDIEHSDAKEAFDLMEDADAPPKPMTKEERAKFEQDMLNAGWGIKEDED